MNVNYIIKSICEKWGITEEELKSKERINVYVKARIDVAETLRRELGLSYNSIGMLLGGRDHTTVMSYLGVKKRVDKVVNEKSAK
jgi:chromosomal replication initiation ATPase DnaA